MILKTPALPKSTGTLHLSVLDQNTVRVFTQTLTIFPFPDISQAETAVRAISKGLRAALDRYPFLAGTLSLIDEVSGKLSLTYPMVISESQWAEFFACKHIPPGADEFPHTYEQLRRDGMPPSAFKGDVFRPHDLLKYPGIPPNGEGMVDFGKGDMPAMRVQANFIPGGLVLSIYAHHSVMDCSGIANFWTDLAGHISMEQRRSGGEVQLPETPPDQPTLRLELDARIRSVKPGQRPTADSYVDGTYKYPKTLEEGTPCSQKFFIMSAERIRNFRSQLKSHFPNESPPTICNVLAALLWIHVTRARAKRLGDCGQKETNVGIAVDLRKRLNPPLDASYMGNMALFSKGTLKVADLIGEEHVTERTIVHVIKEIRRAISRVNDDWVLEHLAFFKSIEQIRDTECALGFRFGLDIYITSWMNFGADIRWGIPGTDLDKNSLDGRPEFIRRTYGPSDGGMMIMPRRRHLVNGVEAPYEVMVRLASTDMETLLHEEGGLSSWAERVID